MGAEDRLVEHALAVLLRASAPLPDELRLPSRLCRRCGERDIPRFAQKYCGVCRGGARRGQVRAAVARWRQRQPRDPDPPPVERSPVADWRSAAACRGMDPALFFPGRGRPTAPALAVCERCPAREPCLAFALASRQLDGVWGGLSTRKRRPLSTGVPREKLLSVEQALAGWERERERAIAAAAAAAERKRAEAAEYRYRRINPVRRAPLPGQAARLGRGTLHESSP